MDNGNEAKNSVVQNAASDASMQEPVIAAQAVEQAKPLTSDGGTTTSKKEGWFTDTRKAIITLLATPLTVAVTIYFTDWIKAPKPEIQYVSWTKYWANFPPPDKLKEAVTSNKLLVAILRDGLERVNSTPSINWLNGIGNWNSECQDAFYKVSFEVEGILQDMFNEKSTRRSGKLSTFMPVTQEQITENTQAIDIIENFQKELHAISQRPKAYTGEVDFVVGLLNSGDADGVIYDEATLKFKGKEITIFAEDFTTAKAHSFEKVTFAVPAYLDNDFVGKYNEKDTTLIKEWTKVMKDKEIVSYEIEITFNGKGKSYSGKIDH